jgi:hypothetical protein
VEEEKFFLQLKFLYGTDSDNKRQINKRKTNERLLACTFHVCLAQNQDISSFQKTCLHCSFNTINFREMTRPGKGTLSGYCIHLRRPVRLVNTACLCKVFLCPLQADKGIGLSLLVNLPCTTWWKEGLEAREEDAFCPCKSISCI